MRILMVNDYAVEQGWGAEIYMSRLVDGLRAAGVEVELFTGKLHPKIREAYDVWDPRTRRAVAQAATRFGADVVHHQNVVRRLTISVVGVPRGVPTVMTFQDLRLFGEPEGFPPKRVRDAYYRVRARFELGVARRNVHVAMANAESVARRLRDAGFRDVERVAGIAPTGPPPETVPVEEATDVVFAGRLGADKGSLVLAKAFEKIAAAHPQARLVMAGEGPERDAIEAVAGRIGRDRLVLTGKLDGPGVQQVMARARVLVSASIPSLRPEGGPATLVEAAMLGRPLIATDDPASREFIDRSGGGEVVAAGSVEELAGALDRVLSDAAAAAHMGAKARELAAAEHTVEAVVPRVMAVYRRAIDAAKR